jgi:hypothetical protein
MEDRFAQLARLAARESGLTALFRLPPLGGAQQLWLLCTEKGAALREALLVRLAKKLEGLTAMAREGEDGLLCLFEEEPPLLMRALCESGFVYPREAEPLWEWRPRTAVPDPDATGRLQRAENAFWALVIRTVQLADSGELLEAAALTGQIRRDLLLPLLEAHNNRFAGSETYRAGNYAEQLCKTHPALDRESVLDALEAERQIFFALRYEMAGESFRRSETLELQATRLLLPEEEGLPG